MTTLAFLTAVFALIVALLARSRAEAAVARESGDVAELRDAVARLEGRAAPPPEPPRSAPVAPPPPVTAPSVPRPTATVAPRPRPGPTPAEQAVTRAVGNLRQGWDRWVAENLLAVAGGVFVLLGAAFFVAVAVSHGWLTPARQVAGVVDGRRDLLALGVRSWRPDPAERAWRIVAQALVGTGAGTMLLGLVAGARLYHPALYGEPSASPASAPSRPCWLRSPSAGGRS